MRFSAAFRCQEGRERLAGARFPASSSAPFLSLVDLRVEKVGGFPPSRPERGIGLQLGVTAEVVVVVSPGDGRSTDRS
jgi:hypothetical protein